MGCEMAGGKECLSFGVQGSRVGRRSGVVGR